MAELTPVQIAVVAYRAGFTEETALTRAVAVALAESGGNTLAVNINTDSTRSRDRGLWQINDRWHPEVSDAAAFDPAQAAAATYRISNGGKSWSPWATWTNGSATAQLGRARLAAASAITVGHNGSVSPADIPDWIPGADQLNKVPRGDIGPTEAAGRALALVLDGAKWVANAHNWLRVVEVIAGVGVAVIGLRLLADTGVGGPVGDIARGTKKVVDTTAKAAAAAAKVKAAK